MQVRHFYVQVVIKLSFEFLDRVKLLKQPLRLHFILELAQPSEFREINIVRDVTFAEIDHHAPRTLLRDEFANLL